MRDGLLSKVCFSQEETNLNYSLCNIRNLMDSLEIILTSILDVKEDDIVHKLSLSQSCKVLPFRNIKMNYDQLVGKLSDDILALQCSQLERTDIVQISPIDQASTGVHSKILMSYDSTA